MTPNEISEASACFACIEDKAAARLYLLGRIAAITDPTVIASDSAGFDLPIPDQVLALVLLAQMAGVTNLDEIISGSAGYRGLNERAAALYLAEVIASNGSGGSLVGMTWGPNPAVLGNLNFSQQATGFTDSTINLIGVTSVTGELELSQLPSLTAFTADSLTSVGAVGAGIGLALGGTSIVSVLLPAIVNIGNVLGGELGVASNPFLIAIDVPELTTIWAGINAEACTSLVSVNVPVWLPTDGAPVMFLNCALDVTSVNLILARCIAAGVTTCTIDLSGGTSATPTGQGITDKADLITAGNTVNTN